MKFTKPQDSRYFKIRSDFYETPEVKELSNKYGSRGTVMLLALYGDIYESKANLFNLDSNKINQYSKLLLMPKDIIFEILNKLRELNLVVFDTDEEEITESSLPMAIRVGL